jgi:hypothetical protein
VRTKIWIVAFVVSLAFAAACNGQVGDAVSSIASGTALPSVSRSISLPTRSDEVATPSDVPSEAPSEEPTQAPTAEPTEEPTGEPTEEPTEAPSEQPTETPIEAPTEEPTPVDSESAAPGGEASSGTSTALWWLLGVAIVVAVAVWLIARRRRPSATLQEAYAATAAARDRLALEASAPSATPGSTEALLDQADQKLRAAQVAEVDQAGRAAVDHALSALGEAREALALRAASTGAAHASGTDIEARLLRSIAALDAALGALRTASGGETGSTTGFEG